MFNFNRMIKKMETKCEHLNRKTVGKKHRKAEQGNALIYVLIAIVLFAALSFTLSNQTDTSEIDPVQRLDWPPRSQTVSKLPVDTKKTLQLDQVGAEQEDARSYRAGQGGVDDQRARRLVG